MVTKFCAIYAQKTPAEKICKAKDLEYLCKRNKLTAYGMVQDID